MMRTKHQLWYQRLVHAFYTLLKLKFKTPFFLFSNILNITCANTQRDFLDAMAGLGHYHTKCVENELLTISDLFYYLFEDEDSDHLINEVGKIVGIS
jgi:hypothetical protein